jgi:PAS domain S-box-containing protein
MDLSGRIDHWNPAAEALFGYSAEKTIGQNISLLVPSDLEEERRELVASIHNGAPPRQIETERLNQDGERIEVALTLSLIKGPDGNNIGYAAILQDIRQRRRLEKQVTAAAEAEKQRIGMELHDGLGSLLTVTDCRTTSFSRTLEKAGYRAEAAEALGIAIEIRGAIRSLRSLASGLQPLDDQPESLIVALRNLASRTCQAKRMQCRFLAPRQPLGLRDASVANHLLSIASEAVQNAVRHSGGTRVTIQLKNCGGGLILSISDNGNGFPVEKMESAGMGLGTMHCRAHLIGGKLSIQRRRGGGTRVVCEAGRIVNQPASA